MWYSIKLEDWVPGGAFFPTTRSSISYKISLGESMALCLQRFVVWGFLLCHIYSLGPVSRYTSCKYPCGPCLPVFLFGPVIHSALVGGWARLSFYGSACLSRFCSLLLEISFHFSLVSAAIPIYILFFFLRSLILGGLSFSLLKTIFICCFLHSTSQLITSTRINTDDRILVEIFRTAGGSV